MKVRHEIRRAGEEAKALTEFHDIVYREAPKAGDAAPAPVMAPTASTWERKWMPDDVLLFRYSALTFNGHRIHYDRKYVTEVEGYPGLIVHGPMLATLMLDLLRHERPDAVVTRYEFKAMRPGVRHQSILGVRRTATRRQDRKAVGTRSRRCPEHGRHCGGRA